MLRINATNQVTSADRKKNFENLKWSFLRQLQVALTTYNQAIDTSRIILGDANALNSLDPKDHFR